ncbi:MAG: circadian clock KaiB family protein [Nitrospirota bacterium]
MVKRTVKTKERTALEEFERALARKDIKFVLRLYVTGATKRSAKAIENIRRICETYLKDRYELEVVDIYQQPEAAGEEQVIAAPTLVKKLPLPIRKLIGDMSDEDRILIGLGLKQQKETVKTKRTPAKGEREDASKKRA